MSVDHAKQQSVAFCAWPNLRDIAYILALVGEREVRPRALEAHGRNLSDLSDLSATFPNFTGGVVGVEPSYFGSVSTCTRRRRLWHGADIAPRFAMSAFGGNADMSPT